MRFLNPWAFLGFLSLPIIVGLHLRLERNKRMVISSMFLWSFLEDKFEGEKPKFIQLSWLLLLDLSIAIVATFALAQPIIMLPSLSKQAVQRIILIDNSTSMLALDGSPDRISMAKEMAISLISDEGKNDEGVVITIGGNAELLGSTLALSEEELITAVRDLKVQGSGIDLRAGLSLAQSVAIPNLPTEVFVITDGAYEPIHVSDFKTKLQWVFIGYEENNQAIIDPALGTKSANSDLFFYVSNFSPNPVEREISLIVNQREVQLGLVNLPPNSVVPQLISLAQDAVTVEIVLSGQDELPEDDTAFIVNQTSPIVRVALVAEFPAPLDRAMAAVPGVELNVLAPFEYSVNFDYDLVVFRGVLPENLPEGKVILFDLPVEDNQLERPAGPIKIGAHEVVDGLELTGVRWESVWAGKEKLAGETLIQAGNLPLLILNQGVGGDVFYFLPQLERGNFTQHPSFPIFISNLIHFAEGFNPKPNYFIGDRINLDDFKKGATVFLKTPNDNELVQVLRDELVLDQLGVYTIELVDQNGEMEIFQFGVNAGPAIESAIRPGDWKHALAENNQVEPTGLQVVEVNLSAGLVLLVSALMVLEAWRAWR